MKTTLQIEKPGQCHNYSIFIASKYFDTLEDFFNLERAVKRFRGTLEKFHYNPISLTRKTMHFFPNVETLYLYNEKDEYLEGGRINWYCIMYKVSCKRAREIREEFNEENEGEIIQFQNLIFKREDAIEIYEQNKDLHKNKKEEGYIDYIIPEGVKEIDNDTLFKYPKSIQIPVSVTRINKIDSICDGIDNMIIPEGVKELGDYCFSANEFSTISLPTTLTKIGIQCFDFCRKLTKIEIPNSITNITKRCFKDCIELKEIIIPTSVKEIGKKAFKKCKSLQSINIPTTVEKIGLHCFNKCSSLTSISIPINENQFIEGNYIYIIENGELNSYSNKWNIKEINGKRVEEKRIMTIPSLSKYKEIGIY